MCSVPRGRVALVAGYPYAFGGAERVLELLARELLARGWSVRVVLPDDGEVARHLATAGLSVEVVKAPRPLLVYGRRAAQGFRAVAAAVALPLYWLRIRRRLHDVDLVHAFGQRGVLLVGPAASSVGVPLVWHVGAAEPGRAVNRFAATMASAVVAVSSAAAEHVPGSARPTIVANAVDPAVFDVDGVGSDDGADIMSAARLTAEKGVDVLVRAVALLRHRGHNVRAAVLGPRQAGHEAYADHVASLATELGVADAVSFRGFVDQPFRHWAGARVYVQPSRREGFGLAAAEAMASGLPVVASGIGGLAEVVGDAGVLVPPDDPQALADAVAALLDDPERAARLAAAGRERAATTYTVERMVDGIEAVYRSISRA